MENVSEPVPVNGRSLWKLLTRLKASPVVYPLEPIAPPNSEFFTIDTLRRIRVIRFPIVHDEAATLSTWDRCSWTEDYWFTRWTKPLQQNSTKPDQSRKPQAFERGLSQCGCSFRRHSERSRRSPSPITDCERYIERLVSRSIAEVLQELTKLRSGCEHLHNGLDNAGFLKDGDEHCPANNVTIRGSERAESRRVVLLYHGIGSGADVWRSVGMSLASRGYYVLAADMLGHGYSSTPDRSHLYTFNSLLADALRLFDHYTVESDKCILIGHSYGCSLVTALARVRADRTVQLVLISGGGPTPLCAVNNAGTGLAWRLLRAVLVVPLLFCGVRRQMFYPPRGKHHQPCPVHPVAVPAHVLRHVVNGQNWPQGDAALHRRILVPTLLVHGMLDDRVTLVQQCEMERTIPRAFLELLPDTGHMAMLENPEHLSHMILCFMDWWYR